MSSLNARQEAFARNLVKGKTQDAAYREAGYSPNRFNASRLLNTNENVKRRVQELQAKMETRTIVTSDSLIAELEESRQLAAALGQVSAAVAATMGKAKIRGLIVNRTESGAPGEFAAMDADALRNWIAKQIEGVVIREAETALTEAVSDQATLVAPTDE